MRKLIGKIYRRALPHGAQARLDCLRARPSWRAQQAIFVHVPKAAGFSVSNALYGKALGHIRAETIKRYSPREFDQCFKFAFVRHPVTRYISALSYVRENYQALHGSPGLPPEHLLPLGPLEFFDEWLADIDLADTNFVFQPQADFIFDRHDTLLVDYLARFEDFDGEIEHLARRLPRLATIQRLNASGSAAVSYPFEQLDARLRQVYARDYRLLGYQGAPA
tara:strand:+ start:1264 stop:1929 length:666 start_codon:yes stop_codon:yes gene_type:complete